MNARNTIAKTFAISLLALTATFAWANDGSGTGPTDFGDSANQAKPSGNEKFVYERVLENRFREGNEEISHMIGNGPDHNETSPTDSGKAGAAHDPAFVPAPPDVQLPGDLTGDDLVNIDDLLLVVNSWGDSCKESKATLLADIAPEGGDCTVDFDDMLVVLTNWGN